LLERIGAQDNKVVGKDFLSLFRLHSKIIESKYIWIQIGLPKILVVISRELQMEPLLRK
jgi:hypothetical protein